MMKTSQQGIDLIKEHEGCMLRAYDDLQPWENNITEVKGTLTIGYGHTGEDVFIGQVITQEEADYLLIKDLKWAEEAVNKLFDHYNWTKKQNRFDALVSWVYNTGAGNLKKRSLIRHIDLLHEAEKLVAYYWNRYYITSKGVKLAGLVKRRKEESIIYLNKNQNYE